MRMGERLDGGFLDDRKKSVLPRADGFARSKTWGSGKPRDSTWSLRTRSQKRRRHRRYGWRIHEGGLEGGEGDRNGGRGERCKNQKADWNRDNRMFPGEVGETGRVRGVGAEVTCWHKVAVTTARLTKRSSTASAHVGGSLRHRLFSRHTPFNLP